MFLYDSYRAVGGGQLDFNFILGRDNLVAFLVGDRHA